MALFKLQLIEKENVKAVVSMNEDYELQLFSNNAEVSNSLRDELFKRSKVTCGLLVCDLNQFLHKTEMEGAQCWFPTTSNDRYIRITVSKEIEIGR